MLSNLCNYAPFHKKCPASCIKMKQIMPSGNVYKILDELAGTNYDGRICFHIYNEPLMDPRLFVFLKYVKTSMPKSQILIYSNAYYLTETIMQELIEAGMDILTVTAYSDAEYERLKSIDLKVPYKVIRGELDDRLDYYNTAVDEIDSHKKCMGLLYQVPIYVNGDLGICCLDYLHSYGLGIVFHNSLRNILNSERVVEFQMKLLDGENVFTICQNCGWSLYITER